MHDTINTNSLNPGGCGKVHHRLQYTKFAETVEVRTPSHDTGGQPGHRAFHGAPLTANGRTAPTLGSEAGEEKLPAALSEHRKLRKTPQAAKGPRVPGRGASTTSGGWGWGARARAPRPHSPSGSRRSSISPAARDLRGLGERVVSSGSENSRVRRLGAGGRGVERGRGAWGSGEVQGVRGFGGSGVRGWQARGWDGRQGAGRAGGQGLGGNSGGSRVRRLGGAEGKGTAGVREWGSGVFRGLMGLDARGVGDSGGVRGLGGEVREPNVPRTLGSPAT